MATKAKVQDKLFVNECPNPTCGYVQLGWMSSPPSCPRGHGALVPVVYFRGQ